MTIIFGLSLLSTACQEEGRTPEQSRASLELLVDIAGGKAPGAALERFKSLEDATALVVSIENAAGAVVYESEQVDLYSFDGTYLSHPLSLLPGSYALTEFLVVDASGSVLYATPVEGAETAYLVQDPLDISFDVSKDAVTTVRPEVLSTAEHTPEDFGYASFEPIVVDVFDFLVAAFVYDPDTRALVLTTATIEITNENGVALYADSLDALTNQITVPDGHAEYRVTISKPGYASYSETFTADALAAYFDSTANGPLEVVLQESMELASCQEILDAGLSTGDGLYTIDPDGAGAGVAPFDVYCDMNTLGGGWTLFAYHTDTNDVIEANPVELAVEGALSDERWLALRDRMTEGMMFIDEHDQVSMISIDKLRNGNCVSIDEISSLIGNTANHGRLWYAEAGCDGTGIDYSEIYLVKNSTYGASVYQCSPTKFDTWPYSGCSSYTSSNTLAYFLK